MSRGRKWDEDDGDLEATGVVDAPKKTSTTTTKADWKNAEMVTEFEEVDGTRFRVVKLVRKVQLHRPYSMKDLRASWKRYGEGAKPSKESAPTLDAVQVLELGMIDPLEKQCRDETHRLWGEIEKMSVTVKDSRLLHWKESMSKVAASTAAAAPAAAASSPTASSPTGTGEKKTWAEARQDKKNAKVAAASPSGGSGELISKNVVRVSNLSDFISEAELYRLFGEENNLPPIKKLYIAKDQATNQRRGFAYITYNTEADGIAVVAKMGRTYFKSTVMTVDFGTTKAPKDKK